jgi:hypothetical protein
MVKSLLLLANLKADSISSLISLKAFDIGIILCGLRPYVLLKP